MKSLDDAPALMRLYDALGSPAGDPLATARLDAAGVHRYGWLALEEPWRIRAGLYLELAYGSIEGYVFRDDGPEPDGELVDADDLERTMPDA